MPGGILEGNGCRDSVQRAYNQNDLFLAIRYHGTPFVVEQHRHAETAKRRLTEQETINEKVSAQIAAGALPLMRKVVKGVFMLFLAPYYFATDIGPRLLKEKVIRPARKMAAMLLERIISPIGKVIHSIVQPFVRIYEKIQSVRRSTVAAIEAPFLAASRMIKSTKESVFGPPIRFLGKVQKTASQWIKQSIYYFRVTKTWAKLLLRYTIELVHAEIVRKDIPK